MARRNVRVSQEYTKGTSTTDWPATINATSQHSLSHLQMPIFIRNAFVQINSIMLPSTTAISQFRLQHLAMISQTDIASTSRKIASPRPMQFAVCIGQAIVQVNLRATVVSMHISGFGDEERATFQVDAPVATACEEVACSDRAALHSGQPLERFGEAERTN